MNTEIKFRVTLGTNNDARKVGERGKLGAFRARHNGGKVVIVTCDDADAFRAWADEANDVKAYEEVAS